MNEILLLVLTWLPVIAESGLFVILARFIAKKLKDHFSIPNQIVEENKSLKGELAKCSKELMSLKSDLLSLKEEIHKASLQMKGIKANESIKKN